MSEDSATNDESVSHPKVASSSSDAMATVESEMVASLQKTINKDLANVNAKINLLDPRKLKHKFRWFKSQDDDPDKCKKLLKLKLSNLIRSNAEYLYKNENVLPYYVVVDFEATCHLSNPPDYKHEIIEFPAVLVNSATFKVEDTFRQIVRPTINTQLSDFCQQLTGITQKDVDEADIFPTVLRKFESWLKSHNLSSKDFCLVTDGPWDVCRFLYIQCFLSNVPFPKWAEKWLDVRKVFSKFYQEKKLSLAGMLEALKFSFEGRQHCGLDDAKNIARVLIQLMCDGAILAPNEMLTAASKSATHLATPKPVDPVSELSDQLSQFTIQAERAPIVFKEKFLNYREAKKVRSKKVHALMKQLENVDPDNLGLDESQQLEDFEPVSVCRTPIRKKNKGQKKKR